MRKLIVLVLILAAAVAGFLWWRSSKKAGAEARFRTEKVDKGDVVATVSASGTLNAVPTVSAGRRASGVIARFHATSNSGVERGQPLGGIVPLRFQATVDQRRAGVARQRIDLRNSELQFVRAKSLYDQQLLSKAEYDIAQATRDGAAASVRQSEAALQQSEANLSYTRIASPISGVVVARQIDVGQTVAASFQAPTLFTIAQDLTKMQVLTNIDEADIGRVREGQKAVFSVDAFPDGSFPGQVSQIRLSPQTVQNVVTYPVLLDVANPEGRLRPGMTANVQIPVDSREGVLRVPNAALRFKPSPDMLVAQKAPEAAGATEGKNGAGEKKPDEAKAGSGAEPSASNGNGGRRSRGGGREGGPPGARGGGRGPSRSGTVYVEAGKGKLRPVTVRTLITDGNYTAIESKDLSEGDSVVLGLATSKAALTAGGAGRPPNLGGGGGGVGRGM